LAHIKQRAPKNRAQIRSVNRFRETGRTVRDALWLARIVVEELWRMPR
jgi:ribosomal protein S14